MFANKMELLGLAPEQGLDTPVLQYTAATVCWRLLTVWRLAEWMRGQTLKWNTSLNSRHDDRNKRDEKWQNKDKAS